MGSNKLSKMVALLDREFKEVYRDVEKEVEAFRYLYSEHRSLIVLLGQWEWLKEKGDPRAQAVRDEIVKRFNKLKDYIGKQRKLMEDERRKFDFIKKVCDMTFNEIKRTDFRWNS